ncbi:MAG: rhomboid family intramembrane serine protease [Phycisphaerales bacterium]|jgi:membrane associated rhomboid family serine protease|nr:rhomboid family intramembrane serine protease [Phycisphaerales bacterium]
MGLADRDYLRETPRSAATFASGGMGTGQSWLRTVNAWLIIVCVAVFVLDGFLTQFAGPIETGRYWVEQPNQTWVEVEGTPFFGTQDRPADTHLGKQRTSLKVTLKDRKGLERQEVITGLPVYDGAGTLLGIAEGHNASPIQRFLHFSTKKVVGGAELWRLIGFQFLHADLFHLMFNMIALYFFGPLIERVLGGKRYLAFYLLCGVAGGLLYLLLNLAGYVWVGSLGLPAIPGLLFNATGTPLIGASAGVFGVLVGGAFLAPNVMVLVFFVLPMRLATVAWVLIVISVVSIFFGAGNAGGEAAHLGGAIAGFGFIRHPDRLHRFFDWLGRFDPTSRRFRTGGQPSSSPPRHDEIDRILAKISREGLQSLNAREKKVLQEASQRDDLR